MKKRYVVQNKIGPIEEPTEVWDNEKKKVVASFPLSLGKDTRHHLAVGVANTLNAKPSVERKFCTHGQITMSFFMNVMADSENEAEEKTHEYLNNIQLNYGDDIKVHISPDISTVDISDVTTDESTMNCWTD